MVGMTDIVTKWENKQEPPRFDTNLIDDIEFDGIKQYDCPDYCDAFICYATYNGREMTDEELEFINDYERDFMYEALMDYLH